jgi:hypothetical protein
MKMNQFPEISPTEKIPPIKFNWKSTPNYQKAAFEYEHMAIRRPHFSSEYLPEKLVTEYRLSLDDETHIYHVHRELMEQLGRDASRHSRRMTDRDPRGDARETYAGISGEILLLLIRQHVRKSESTSVTRKDYTIIADGIAGSALLPLQKRIIAEDLGKKLKIENPNFNADKFVEAATKTNVTDHHTTGTAPAYVRIDEEARF